MYGNGKSERGKVIADGGSEGMYFINLRGDSFSVSMERYKLFA